MTMPALIVEQPDLEAWVWANVGHLHGVTSFTYSAQQQWPGWQYVYGVQVDCRSRRRQAARRLAEQVRQIVCGLADVDWPDGVVSYVQPVDGPYWLPDDDGLPRYTTRFEIRVHPRRWSAGIPPDTQLSASP